MDLSSFFDAIVKVLSLVLGSSSTATLSAVGLILLLLTGVMAYIAVKSKPEELSTFLKVSLFLCLTGGLLFSAAGPSLALFYVSQNSIKTTTSDQAFNDLISNERVHYVIRLISYNPNAKPELEIGGLRNLGPPKQIYSFVANYGEVVGRTVKEALEMIGIGYAGGNRVSAVIFPIRTDLYPANSRGLLQVIREVENRSDIDIKDRFLKPDMLNADEVDDLADKSVPSYRVENFKKFYPHYCQLARTFYCSQYPSRELVGGLYIDWHPLGFSQKDPPSKPCNIPIDTFCAFSDWTKAREDFHKHFGSRAFLTNNLAVDKIPGRILIDFEDPVRNVIPDIGAR